jgi:hypothetical protein
VDCEAIYGEHCIDFERPLVQSLSFPPYFPLVIMYDSTNGKTLKCTRKSIWHTCGTVREDFLWLLIENGVVSGIYRYFVRAIQPLQRLLKLKRMEIGGG